MNTELQTQYQKIYESIRNKVKRKGWKELLEHYEVFYLLSPASTKYHLNFECGLMYHSINVYLKFKQRLCELKENIPEESIIIASIMHDLCKVGAYDKYLELSPTQYKYNKNHPKGHAKLSIDRIKQFMELTELEEDLIKYHMGTFGILNFDKSPEYTIEDWQKAIQNNYLVQVFASCDMECAQMERYM